MQQQPKKILTQEERDAITAKYQRRIIELGIPIFGPPAEGELGPDVLPFPDPHAEERAAAAAQGRAKAQELQDRIVEATIQLLEAAPPPDESRHASAPTKSMFRKVSTARRSLPASTHTPPSRERRSRTARRWRPWGWKRSRDCCRSWKPSGTS
jgi:hypothetical protein